MTSHIERDVTIWLNSKLEEPWSSQKITAYITSEFLQNVKTRFSTLDTAIKIRFLLSFVNLKKKTLLDLDKDITDILQLAQQDEDEWVKVVAQLLSTLSKEKQLFDADLLQHEIFQIMRKELCNELTDMNLQFCPLEYPYLSPKLIPPLPSVLITNTHFKLKKPPVVSLKPPSTPSTPKKIPSRNTSDEFITNAQTPAIAKSIKPPGTPPIPSTPTQTPTNGAPSIKPKEKRKMQVMDIAEVKALKQQEIDAKKKKEKKDEKKEEGEEVKEGDALKDGANALERKRKKKEEDPNQPQEKKERKKKEEDPNKPKRAKKKKDQLPTTPTTPGLQSPMSPLSNDPRRVPFPNFNPQIPVSILQQQPFRLPSNSGSELNLTSLLAQTLSATSTPLSFLSPQIPQIPVTSHKTDASALTPYLSHSLIAYLRTPALITAENLLENCNKLTPENRKTILAFLSGHRVNPNPANGPVQQIVLNYEEKVNQNNQNFAELLVFEINYETGTWRKLRRKKPLEAAPPVATPLPPVPPQQQ